MSQDFLLRQRQSEMLVEWRIPRFLSRLEESGFLHSPAFQFSDKQWYLEIWPNGHPKRHSFGYVSLFLYPRFHVFERCTMGAHFGIITADREPIVLHKFECLFKSVAGLGQIRFVPHSLLIGSENVLSPDGTFTICALIAVPRPVVLEDGINVPREISLRGDSPQEASVEWKVENFFSHPKVSGLSVTSPTFELADAKWCLEVFPNGQDPQSLEWVSLMLKRVSSKSEKQMAVYTLGIRKRDGSPYRLVHFVREFDGNKAQGIKEFLRSSELLYLETELISEESIALYCTARVYPSHLDTRTPMKHDAETSSDTKHEKKASQSTSSEASAAFSDSATVDYSASAGASSDVSAYSDVSASAIIDVSASDVGRSQPDCEKFQENFLDFFLSRRLGDVKISVENEHLTAHRVILAARSPVFSAMFENDTEENRTGVVDVNNFDVASFKDFLSVLYSGDLKVVSSSNALSLYKAAVQYELQDKDLKYECVRCLQNGLNLESFLQVVPMLKSEPNLWGIAMTFYVNNESEIESSPEWKKLRFLNREEANVFKVTKIVKDIETHDKQVVERLLVS